MKSCRLRAKAPLSVWKREHTVLEEEVGRSRCTFKDERFWFFFTHLYVGQRNPVPVVWSGGCGNLICFWKEARILRFNNRKCETLFWCIVLCKVKQCATRKQHVNQVKLERATTGDLRRPGAGAALAHVGASRNPTVLIGSHAGASKSAFFIQTRSARAMTVWLRFHSCSNQAASWHLSYSSSAIKSLKLCRGTSRCLLWQTLSPHNAAWRQSFPVQQCLLVLVRVGCSHAHCRCFRQWRGGRIETVTGPRLCSQHDIRHNDCLLSGTVAGKFHYSSYPLGFVSFNRE